jgi:hypothetical protein
MIEIKCCDALVKDLTLKVEVKDSNFHICNLGNLA